MRSILFGLLAVVVLAVSGVTLLGSSAVQAKKADEERILGSWVIVKGEDNGRDLPAAMIGIMKMTFSKDGKLGFDLQSLSNKVPDLRYKFVGAGQIDLGPDNEFSPGIYRFDSDERVTICFNDSKDGKRPTEFASKEGSRHILFVLERAKADDKLTQEQKNKANVNLGKAIEKTREEAYRTVNANNLKQIALSFHMHHDITKSLPLHAIYSKDGKTPLLSWRVTILPLIEQDALYKQFKLDEPWDSEHNKKLIPLMPVAYAPPAEAKRKEGMTYYQVFTGPDSLFDGNKKMTLQDLVRGDGTSNTILAIDGAEPVIWTKPQDLELPKDKGKMPAVGGLFPNDRVQVAICDGAVRTIPRSLAPDILRALVTPNGKEVIDWNKIDK